MFPSSVMYLLGFQDFPDHILINSPYVHILLYHKLEQIYSASKTHQVLYTYFQRRISFVEPHAIDVDKRESVMTIILDLIENIAAIQVKIHDAFLV